MPKLKHVWMVYYRSTPQKIFGIRKDAQLFIDFSIAEKRKNKNFIRVFHYDIRKWDISTAADIMFEKINV